MSLLKFAEDIEREFPLMENTVAAMRAAAAQIEQMRTALKAADEWRREVATATPKLLDVFETVTGHVMHYGAMPHAHSNAYRDVANARAVIAKARHDEKQLPVLGELLKAALTEPNAVEIRRVIDDTVDSSYLTKALSANALDEIDRAKPMSFYGIDNTTNERFLSFNAVTELKKRGATPSDYFASLDDTKKVKNQPTTKTYLGDDPFNATPLGSHAVEIRRIADDSFDSGYSIKTLATKLLDEINRIKPMLRYGIVTATGERFLPTSELLMLEKRGVSAAEYFASLDAEKKTKKQIGMDMSAPTELTGYLVLTIDNTANAAFTDIGRDNEIARIIKDAADEIVDFDVIRPISIPLRDINGNTVGRVKYDNELPRGEPLDGTVRLSIKGLDDGVNGSQMGGMSEGEECARMLREAAKQIANGERIFTMRDTNGHVVGKTEWREEASLDKNGTVDMDAALMAGRVYSAEGGYSGIADGEFRYVVTTNDFTPGYRQGGGDGWLVNAKGEKAAGYDEPQFVKEVLLTELTKAEKSDLRAVVEGRVSFDDFEKTFASDDPEPD